MSLHASAVSAHSPSIPAYRVPDQSRNRRMEIRLILSKPTNHTPQRRDEERTCRRGRPGSRSFITISTSATQRLLLKS
jgi:hypothetical protein